MSISGVNMWHLDKESPYYVYMFYIDRQWFNVNTGCQLWMVMLHNIIHTNAVAPLIAYFT